MAHSKEASCDLRKTSLRRTCAAAVRRMSCSHANPAGVAPPSKSIFGDIAYDPVPQTGDGVQPWHRPVSGVDKGLKVKNTLSSVKGSLDSFVPSNGNRVLWYTCGPTVYDSCHMGHARAYLTFDILRRITEDYFKYDVLYHINITDVDDKIIKKARTNFLLAEYKKEGHSKEVVLQAMKDAQDALSAKLLKKQAELEVPLPETAISKDKEERETALKGVSLKLTQLAEAVAAVKAASEGSDVNAIVDAGKDALGEKLDGEKGATVTDHSVFDAHAKKYENEYFEDMETLGVRPPDVLTRVTEYVPQIVDYIKKIVDKNLAYASNGSVYLSIDEFKKQGHTYRKLDPGADTSAEAMAEGEGALAADESEKRNKNDFALWKASQPGEPAWPSPWGEGRPGWHIECSVVASDILGPVMDVHAGGVDLKFPHHDNELAQSEACYGHGQWVNYFYHAGHLSIKGLKMSKSLKNFITIRQALETTSPRIIRMLFLTQSWHKGMNYSDQALGTAKAKEKTFREFFHKVKMYGRSEWAKARVGWEQGTKDRELMHKLFDAQDAVDKAFKDNFDTVTAINAMESVVSEFNKYEKEVQGKVAVHIVVKIGSYITSIFRILGLVEGSDAIGFGDAEGGGASKEEVLGPVVEAFSEFRKGVRTAARSKDGDASQKVLAACDAVRTSVCGLGIAFEDIGDNSTWKLEDPQVLLRELAEKQAEEQKKVYTKLVGKVQKLEKDLTKSEKVLAVGAPAGMFKAQAKYATYQFDDAGVPVKNDGEDLAKSAVKGIQKELAAQQKAWDALVKSAGSADPAAYVAAQKAEIAEMQAKIVELKKQFGDDE